GAEPPPEKPVVDGHREVDDEQQVQHRVVGPGRGERSEQRPDGDEADQRPHVFAAQPPGAQLGGGGGGGVDDHHRRRGRHGDVHRLPARTGAGEHEAVHRGDDHEPAAEAEQHRGHPGEAAEREEEQEGSGHAPDARPPRPRLAFDARTGSCAQRTGPGRVAAVRNVPVAEVDGIDRAVLAIGTDYPPDHLLPFHRHRRAQFLYGATGVMRVETADGTWTVPTRRAVLIPAGTEHRVAMAGVSTRSLYIEPAAAPWFPERCRVVDVSPLLRELVLAAVDIEPRYPAHGRDADLVSLILHELARLAPLPLDLPLPRDAALRGL